MGQDNQKIYQFMITLEGISPSVWRRLQIPESYSFWDFHVTIQDVMGWKDAHLHAFHILNPQTGRMIKIGIPDDEDELAYIPGWEVPIFSYFSSQHKKARYEYDFGDGWQHAVILEKIVSAAPNQTYPVCLDGARACPPEDCGGVPGYERLLDILKNPGHKEYESTLIWLEEGFDPENFQAKKVQFDNPEKRWEMAFQPTAVC